MTPLSIFFSLLAVKALPYLFAGSVAVTAITARALRNGFNNASKAMHDGVESFQDDIQQGKALKLLGTPNFPAQFAQMPSGEQSSLVSRWLISTNRHRHVFNETELGNFIACLKIKPSSPSYLYNGTDIRPVITALKEYSDRIAESDAAEITKNAFDELKGLGIPSPKSLETISDLTRIYDDIMTEDQKKLCRSHVIEALKTREPNYYRSSFLNERLSDTALKALDILFFPRHSHGGEKSSLNLSIEKGNYTAEETARIVSGAESIITIRESNLSESRKYSYASKSSQKTEDDYFAQIKTKLGELTKNSKTNSFTRFDSLIPPAAN